MELSREQIYFLAGLITSQISQEMDKKLENFLQELSQPKKKEAVKLIDRRKVAQQFGVTSDTISTWCKTGIIDNSVYVLINGRFKFFNDKIMNLLEQQRAGVWEPNKKYVKAH